MRGRGWRVAMKALAGGIPAGVIMWIGLTAPLIAAQDVVRPAPGTDTRVPGRGTLRDRARAVVRDSAPGQLGQSSQSGQSAQSGQVGQSNTGAPATRTRSRYEGRRVIDVLAELQASGARIIYTSSLVPATLVVRTEPRARLPRQLATEILAPHGLALKNGPGGIWLVVRSEVPVAAAPPRPAAPKPAAPRPSTSVAPVAAPPTELYADSSPYVEEHVDVTERLGEFAGQPSVQSVDVAAVREAAGGFESVFHVMPTFPGIAATDDKQGKLAVRGAGPQHNVVMFDGVLMHSPQRVGQFPTSFVNPATAASIAMDASGLDARHGGRLSSVMVLETRDGRTDRRLALSGAASLTNGDILAEGRVPGTTSGSWWANARGTYYRPFSKPFHDGVIPNFSDIQFKVTLRPSEHTRLSVLGLVGQEGMVSVSNALPELLPDNVWRRLHTDNRLAVANLWWTPSRRVSTTTTVSAYSNASSFFNFVLDGQESASFHRDYEIADVAARQRTMVVWRPGHVLDAGVEIGRVRSHWGMSGAASMGREEHAGPDVWGRFNDDDRPISSHLTRTHVGGWLQERVPLVAGLEIEPGLRLDWNSLTGERALQPRVRITKRVERATVWGGVAWQAQTPGHEAMQQGFEFYDFGSPEAATLRNERSRQIVVGVERPLGAGLTLRAEAYRRDFDRLLVQRLENEAEHTQRLAAYEIPPEMPPDSALLEYRPTVHPQSSGTGRASGFELLLQRDGRRFSGWVTYTLSKSERELFGRTVPFDFDRRHGFTAVTSLRLTKSLRLGTTWQFASGFPATPVRNEVQFYHPRLPDGTLDPILRPMRLSSGELGLFSPGDRRRLSLRNTERLEPYARTDVRVTWTPSQRWELYGEVINALNHRNLEQALWWQSSSGIEEAGRQPVYESYGTLFSYGVRVIF